MTTGAYRTANATVGAHGAVAVTPSDSTELPVTRALFIGTAGDVVVTMADGQTPITFANIANATMLPIQVQKVLAATSASDILALY